MTTPFNTPNGGDMYARTAGRRIAPHVADALSEHMIDALRAADRPLRLLDVACGSGGLSLRLARALPRASIIGVDISQDMIAQAQEQAKKEGLENRVTFAVMDTHQLALKTASIDAAICNLGLHLLSRPVEALSEIGRTLAPGARLWASVPDQGSWREFFDITHDVAPDADSLLRGFMVRLEQGAPLLRAFQQARYTVTDQETLRLPFAFADGREALIFFSGLLAPFTALPADLVERLARALDERFPQGLTTSYVAMLVCARWNSAMR